MRDRRSVECPDCEVQFSGKHCPSCGYTPPKTRPTEVYREPEWAKQPPPCTPEQNERAHHLVWAVIDGTVTVDQARQALSEMFQGREVEL